MPLSYATRVIVHQADGLDEPVLWLLDMANATIWAIAQKQ
jgi:hypothetical protein